MERSQCATADQQHGKPRQPHGEIGARAGVHQGARARQAHGAYTHRQRQQVGGPPEKKIEKIGDIGADTANAVVDGFAATGV